MTCECETRMGCIYSVPIGKRLRYRCYQCANCKQRLETVEVPVELVGQEVEAIQARVRNARERRFLAIKHTKKG